MQELIWVTAKKEHIPVCNMDTSHIENCIRKIERSGGRWRGRYLRRLKLEIEIRNMGLTSARVE